MNSVILKGRLTKDIDLKYTQTNNTALASGSIAVDRRFAQEGQPNVDFFNIKAFGKQAEVISKYFKKGSEILIQGHIQNNSWEGQDGTKKTSTDVIIDNFDFCGKKEENSTSNNIPAEVTVVDNNSSDDLPF